MLTWIKNHKTATILALVAILGGIFLYTRRSQPSYQEYAVESGSIRDTLELSGKVTADSQAVLRFPTGGLVTYLGPKEGDKVAKWQTLASVDTRQTQKLLEQKLNLYAIQRGSFEQTVDDNDNSVPDGDLARTLKRLLEKNQYQLDNTVKDVEYLDLSLKLSRLTSPINGLLVRAPIKTSNVSVLATDTWVVVDPSSLYFSADLDETDLKRVEVGQEVEVVLDAYTDQIFKSVVSSIAYTPKETTSGTVFEVKLALPKEEMSKLRLGLNGSATIILSSKDQVMRLPSSAITFDGAKAQVYVKNGNDYTLKDIETGIENDGYVEIINGLTQNERVYFKKSE